MDMTTQVLSCDARTPRAVLIWMAVVAALVALIVLVGGATRLTDSGLSITEWKPIMGAIPPLNADDWHIAFEKYKLIPEYTEVNSDMTLAGFKTIFWWEWGHRFIGRLIGVVFFLPFLWFWIRGALPGRLRSPLLGLFVLGGAQGVLGWYMVRSGLADRVDVSQYRLAAHLGLAVVIYLGFVWMIVREWNGRQSASLARPPRWMALSSGILTALVFLQILSGAFVAGMRAGLSHNTWPLMDGAVIPDGLAAMSPVWRNLFENALTVQFNHRLIAYGIAIIAVVHVWSILWSAGNWGRTRSSAVWLLLSVAAQIALGIATLLAMVPLHLGLIHQAGALLVLTLALIHFADARGWGTT